jgi:hypothetical protein
MSMFLARRIRIRTPVRPECVWPFILAVRRDGMV